MKILTILAVTIITLNAQAEILLTRSQGKCARAVVEKGLENLTYDEALGECRSLSFNGSCVVIALRARNYNFTVAKAKKYCEGVTDNDLNCISGALHAEHSPTSTNSIKKACTDLPKHHGQCLGHYSQRTGFSEATSICSREMKRVRSNVEKHWGLPGSLFGDSPDYMKYSFEQFLN